MQWLQPWGFLWAAFLIPAIIFLYLLKRRYTDRTISSTLLWQRLLQRMEVTRPWQRLQRHLLLLLQLLAALLLIAAVARPAIPTDGVKAAHTVLLFDTSGSMLSREEDKEVTRFALAKDRAVDLIDSLQSGQTMTIVEVANPPRIAVANTNDTRLLKEGIDDMTVSFEGAGASGDFRQSLSLARALASRYENAEVLLISDGSGWGKVNHYPPDRFIPVGKNEQNLATAQFTAVHRGERVEALVRLENTGTGALAGILTLYNDRDQAIDTRAIDVDPGRSEVVTWADLTPAAYYRVTVQSEQDALPEDNEQWAIPVSSTAAREVLYIGAGSSFLEKGLRLDNRIDIVEAADDEASLTLQSGDYPLIIADGRGSSLPKHGNGLLMNPPDDFAGWEWGEIIQPQTKIKQTEHAILEHVFLDDVYISKARQLNPPAGWRVVARSGETPLILAKDTGEQRFVLFTFDLHHSDLPLRPEFPVLMHQIVAWLMPKADTSLAEAQYGEPTVIPVSAEASGVSVITPSGEETALDPESFSVWYTPREIGLHEVQTAFPDQNRESQYFTVPFPASETNIQPQPDLLNSQANQDASSEGMEKTAESGTAELGQWAVLTALLLLGWEWTVFARGY